MASGSGSGSGSASDSGNKSLETARRLLEEAALPTEAEQLPSERGFYDAFVLRGIRVQAAHPGSLLCHYTVPSRLLNSGGFLHGGATASLVDLVASAVFCTAGLRTRGSPLEMNISYLDAAFSDEEIDIEATVLHAGKSVGVAVVELKKKSGKIIAQARYSKYLGASSKL
ncbi:uncharacterized protein LOC133887696 [Phragmites australis]|uniref:uncharacterized protein LOC133887696 n=1 Tax=Phragmites australis TaxID=29695 RepID=UPI002D7A099A|nr:uncharacterized protein LOC133887696 [Phragmites australis]